MKLDFASKIKSLKPGGSFTIKTEKERAKVLRDADTLKRAGVIEFTVTTRSTGKGFLVLAI